MKSILVFLFSFMLLQCNIINQEDTAPLIETTAILYNNNLPVDGCAEHISFIDAEGNTIKQVLPTETSMALFTKLLNSEIANLPKDTYSGNLQVSIILKYKETKEKGELLCGWGHKFVVDKIEIISITKK